MPAAPNLARAWLEHAQGGTILHQADVGVNIRHL